MNVKGLIALILGVLAVVFSFIPVLSYSAIPMAIAALILGILGRKADRQKGLATAGMIVGIVAIVLGVIFSICYTCTACTAAAIDEYSQTEEGQSLLNDLQNSLESQANGYVESFANDLSEGLSAN